MKQVFYSHLVRQDQPKVFDIRTRILHTQSQLIQGMYDIESDEIDLPCFPLFGLFSLAIGMTVVLPDMDPTKPALADPNITGIYF